MMKLHNLSEKERKNLSRKVRDYANFEFGHNETVNDWHDSMLKTIKDFKNRKNWEIEEI